MVQYLESKGMTIYTGNSNPWAPIHRAAANGKLNLVEYFVQKHVNFDLVDRSGYTPFLLACVFGKMDVAKFLHGMGASPRTRASNLNAVKLAQENNQLQILKWLYSLDKTLFTELEDPYETPASQGYIDQCRWLHRLPEPLPFKLESIPKVLSICARHGDIKMMKWLKRRNLPFFDRNETVEAPRALTTSVEYNILPSLQFYLDETDFDGSKIMPSRERHAFLNPTPSSDLIRRSYSKHGSIEAVDILLQLGFSINSCKTGNNRTIVHEICTAGQLKHLKWIFNYGANLNTLDNDGKSPFYVAVKRGNLRLVRWLLKNGASPHAGNSALPIASRPSTSPKMAAFLRDLYRTDET
jgi:ankyrin repeat protein